MAPTPQKDRLISIAGIRLALRPEDLTWSEPSRMAVINTFGGAWIDSFGPGIATITIAGHTGWRGGSDGDWLARFERLHKEVFAGWHDKTKGAADLTPLAYDFVDGLDERVAKVVPQSFTLRRSRSRPLLVQYNIQLLVIEDLGGGGGGGGGEDSSDDDAGPAADSLADSGDAMGGMVGGP